MKLRFWMSTVGLASVLVAGSLGLAAPAIAAPLTPAQPEVARAPQDLFSFVSSPADYIGGGQTKKFTAADGTFTASGSLNFVTISFQSPSDNWQINLAAPIGLHLSPGIYYRAERAEFRTGRAPGIDIFGDGRGCNQDFGSFAINEIGISGQGNINLLSATFTQHCESPTAPPLKGNIQFNAQPLNYSFKSTAGDYIGAGQSKAYFNSTSVFGLTGSTTFVEFTVSGLGDDWTVDLAAPTGSTLTSGTTYSGAMRYPFNGSSPGLTVSGDGRGCNNDYGSFTIHDIEFVNGTPYRLFATLTQTCESTTAPPLIATVHYLD